jgi:hypothetical protein
LPASPFGRWCVFPSRPLVVIHTVNVVPARKRNGEPLPGKFDA